MNNVNEKIFSHEAILCRMKFANGLVCLINVKTTKLPISRLERGIIHCHKIYARARARFSINRSTTTPVPHKSISTMIDWLRKCELIEHSVDGKSANGVPQVDRLGVFA